MSEAKYTAAKELIQEKHYDAARAILKTMNEPKAQNWLTRLDQIAPEVDDFPQIRVQSRPTINKEAEEYYRESNKSRKSRKRNKIIDREARGFQLALGGIALLGLWFYYDYIMPAQNGKPREFELNQGAMMIIGACLFFFIAGVAIMFNAHRARKNVS